MFCTEGGAFLSSLKARLQVDKYGVVNQSRWDSAYCSLLMGSSALEFWVALHFCFGICSCVGFVASACAHAAWWNDWICWHAAVTTVASSECVFARSNAIQIYCTKTDSIPLGASGYCSSLVYHTWYLAHDSHKLATSILCKELTDFHVTN